MSAIDPLLAKVDNVEGRISFYYPGDFDSPASETLLEATVDGQGVPSVAFSGDHTAVLKLGRVGEGDHALSVSVRDRRSGRVLARNDYPICVVKPDEKGPAGKKLNNFVTELYKAPAKDGEAKFFNPREGWVYIGFDRVLPQATVSLDDTAFPVVRHRPEELTETMRYLPCGWHTLHVAGTTGSDATLSVRTLKRIVYLPTSFDPRPQLQVLNSVTKGFNTDDIARQMGISPSGVKKHLGRIFARLGACTRAEAVAIALRRRLAKT